LVEAYIVVSSSTQEGAAGSPMAETGEKNDPLKMARPAIPQRLQSSAHSAGVRPLRDGPQFHPSVFHPQQSLPRIYFWNQSWRRSNLPLMESFPIYYGE